LKEGMRLDHEAQAFVRSKYRRVDHETFEQCAHIVAVEMTSRVHRLEDVPFVVELRTAVPV